MLYPNGINQSNKRVPLKFTALRHPKYAAKKHPTVFLPLGKNGFFTYDTFVQWGNTVTARRSGTAPVHAKVSARPKEDGTRIPVPEGYKDGLPWIKSFSRS
jgi:hypothetical protein